MKWLACPPQGRQTWKQVEFLVSSWHRFSQRDSWGQGAQFENAVLRSWWNLDMTSDSPQNPDQFYQLINSVFGTEYSRSFGHVYQAPQKVHINPAYSKPGVSCPRPVSPMLPLLVKGISDSTLMPQPEHHSGPHSLLTSHIWAIHNVPVSSILQRWRASQGHEGLARAIGTNHMGGMNPALFPLLPFSTVQQKTRQIQNHLQNWNLGVIG